MSHYWQFVVISGVGSALLTVMAMHISLRPWRRSAGAHWTERARLLWPARRAIIGIVVSCMITADMVPRLLKWDWAQATSLWPVIFGTLAGTFVSSREIEPRYTLTVWAQDTFWKLVAQFGVLALFLWQVWAMPEDPQWKDWVSFGAALAGVLVIATGVWLPVVEKLIPSKVSPDGRWERLVDEVSRESGVFPRRIYFADSPMANAGALPFLDSLVVTSRALEVLDDGELCGVIRHELAHLKEPRAVQLARFIPSVAFMGFALGKPVHHHFGYAGFLALAAVILLSLRATRHFARRMESHADASAIESAADTTKYAHALEKLYIVNQVPAVMRNSSATHPHLYDRMVAAGVTPDYPRPAPPGLMVWPGWVMFILPVLTLVAVVLWRRLA